MTYFTEMTHPHIGAAVRAQMNATVARRFEDCLSYSRLQPEHPEALAMLDAIVAGVLREVTHPYRAVRPLSDAAVLRMLQATIAL